MKKLLIETLFLGMALSGYGQRLEKTLLETESKNKIDSVLNLYPVNSNKIPLIIEEKKDYDSIPKLPRYKNLNKDCSLYVMFAGKDLFNKEYTWSDSWDRRYNDRLLKIIDQKQPFEETKDLIEKKILKPGMVLGVYNPNSAENYKTDSRGKTRKYTHVLIYAGKNKEDEYIFFHNYGKTQEEITLNSAKKRGFIPKEIIDSRN